MVTSNSAQETSLDQAITREVRRQLMDGNGRTTEATAGMTLRELVLEVREDVKGLQSGFADHKLRPHIGAISRVELYGSLTGVVGLILGAARLFL